MAPILSIGSLKLSGWANPTRAPQLKATEELIAHSTAAFHQRLGRAKPQDNVWRLNDEPNTQP